jgi:hypothetical protein
MIRKVRLRFGARSASWAVYVSWSRSGSRSVPWSGSWAGSTSRSWTGSKSWKGDI